MIDQIGFRGLSEWLTKLHEKEIILNQQNTKIATSRPFQQETRKQTAQRSINIIEQYADFLNKTTDHINYWIEHYHQNKFLKKTKSNLSRFSSTNKKEEKKHAFSYRKEANYRSSYSFNSNINESDRQIILQIFDGIFLWDQDKRKTSEWVLRMLLTLSPIANLKEKSLIINSTSNKEVRSISTNIESINFKDENSFKKNKREKRYFLCDLTTSTTSTIIDNRNLISSEYKCSGCYVKEIAFTCSTCGTRVYCSENCGKQDWNFGKQSFFAALAALRLWTTYLTNVYFFVFRLYVVMQRRNVALGAHSLVCVAK